MKEDLSVTDNNFEEEVINSPLPVLVDFWASWCIPSQMSMPLLDRLSKEYRDKKIQIKKINVDQNPGVRDKYRIYGCPTFIIFKDGQEVSRKVGAQSGGQIREMIESVL